MARPDTVGALVQEALTRDIAARGRLDDEGFLVGIRDDDRLATHDDLALEP